MSDSIGLDPRIGTDFLGYRIEEVVGRGGMGVVYRAYDLRLKRNAALKLIAPEYAGDDRFRERFLAETELAASLEHPDVVPIYDAGEVDEQLYLAMRFVEGTDLKRLLTAEARLEPVRALAIVSHVADALDAAHELGLVHRDVKPSNVLLDEREHPYLADFGLTRRLDDPASPTAGLSVGTPAYVAPEQIRGDPVDGRADQYALACLFHECLTGEPPFRRPSEVALLFAHLEDAPLPLGGPLDPVLTKALAKDPDERYSTCGSFVQAAREALGLLEPRPRRWPLVAVAVVLALAAAALTAVLLTRDTGSQAPETTGRLIRIDPVDGHILDAISLGNDPVAVVTDGPRAWVADHDASRITRFDAGTREEIHVAAHGTPTDLALAGNRVIVANGPLDSNVALIGVASAAEESLVSLGPAGTSFADAHVAAGKAGVWLATGDRRVGQLDPVRGRFVDPISIPPPADERAEAAFTAIAVGDGAVWVLGDALDRKLWRVDPASRALVATISLPIAPRELAAGEGAVWVTSELDNAIVRIDPRTNRVTDTISVGRGASGVATGKGSVWVANAIDGTVSRIDPVTLDVATIDVEGSPGDVAVGESVWVTADAVPAASDEDAVTIGVLAPCEGDQAFFYDQTLAGAELALLQRGAELAGSRPVEGVRDASVAGQNVELVFGCGDGSAEQALSEARRLVELVGADILIGPTTTAEGFAIRDYAKTQPSVTFLNGLSTGQALTLTDPAPNFFRFSTDAAQWMAGVGDHSFNELGWRRVVVIGEEESFTYAQVAGFLAEFCSLGGSIVEQVWVPRAARDVAPYVDRVPRAGVDGFLLVGNPPMMLGFIEALPELHGNLAGRMVSGSSLGLPQMAEALGARLAGVIVAIQDPGTSDAPVWVSHIADFDRAFPSLAGWGIGPWALSYYNSTSAALQALEAVEGDLSDGQQRFKTALATVELDAPNGHIRLDERRQAIGANYITPYKTDAKGQLAGWKVLRVIEGVDQTFGGYFRPGDPPPGKKTLECTRGNPPPWARR